MGVTVRQKVKGKGNPWWVFISHGGKRTSRQVGDKAAAEGVASKIRAKLQLGEFNLDEPKKKTIPLFKDFAKGFMETYSAMNHKSSTQQSYQSALDQHILPVLGEKPLNEITRKDVKDFINDKMMAGLGTGTVRNLKAYLSCILSEAVDDELIETNPALRTGRLIKKKDDSEEELSELAPLTWEEKTRLEETLQKHYPAHYPLFLTALRTGMRLGELVALQPGDLDFNGGFIWVRRNCSRKRITSTKSGKDRKVDMSNGLAAVLENYLTQRKREALEKGWGDPPEWLFYQDGKHTSEQIGDKTIKKIERGKLIDINNLRNRVFYKALEKAKLRRVRIHDLRHTYATLRISKGDNIVDVSKQLGHSSVKITLDTYTHWMPGGKKSEVDELDFTKAPCKTAPVADEAQVKK
jgi:integrase